MPDFPITPIMSAIIIFALVIVWTIYEVAKKKSIKGLDVVLFYICGIAGLLPLVMIFSQHPFVRINLQLLVLNPLWLFLMSPWTKWKHRWNVALVMVILSSDNFIMPLCGSNTKILKLLSPFFVNDKLIEAPFSSFIRPEVQPESMQSI